MSTFTVMSDITEPGRYYYGGGLYLVASKDLYRRWIFYYKINGHAHYIKLDSFSAEDARKKADEWNAIVKIIREQMKKKMLEKEQRKADCMRAAMESARKRVQEKARETARKRAIEIRAFVKETRERMQKEARKRAWEKTRKKINKLRAMITGGDDLHRLKSVSKTFDECVIEYVADHRNEWKSVKHQKQWISSLQTYVMPYFHKLSVNEITTRLVLYVLQPIWMTKPETAYRIRARIERVLSYATIVNYRGGNNPARWRGHLEELLPKPLKSTWHHPSMPYQEIGAFFRLLNAEKGMGVRALKFTILTASRTSETLLAKWPEIDFAQRLWIIPAERMKSGREHRIPLTDTALKILYSQIELRSIWVFPGVNHNKPLNAGIMRDTLVHMNYADVTVHGFRSSFRMWAAEKTIYPRELAELALAHKQGTLVEEAYQRSDLCEQRRALMQDWEAWCSVEQPLQQE